MQNQNKRFLININYLVILFLVVGILVSSFSFFKSHAENIPDGNYKIPITLMHKYDEVNSMGNNAIVQYGILKVRNGKPTMKVRFVALTFLNFTGYLSEFLVDNKPVNILSTYDIYDGYNHPETGKDKRFKGKKYPKDMEFDIEIGARDIPVHVYVPVMGELASGDQDARLRINWPNNYNAVKISGESFDEDSSTSSADVPSISEDDLINRAFGSKDNRNLPVLEKGEKISLENGHYSVKVSLYHEREEKDSMGNAAMIHDGELYVKDGKAKMLIGSDKMSLQGIIASLVSLQIRDDNAYYHFAQPHAFDLSIPGEQDKRPEVFSFDIERKDPMIYVKVDPKVKPMGEIPVGARLKFDWNTLRKIDRSETILYKKMINGTPRKKFNPNEKLYKVVDGIELFGPPSSFNENVSFKVNKIQGGANYLKIVKSVGRTTAIHMYEFKVENDFGIPMKAKKDVKIKIKLPVGIKSIKAIRASDMSELKSEVSGGYATLTLRKFGEIALVDTSSGKGSRNVATPSNRNGVSSPNRNTKRSANNLKSKNTSGKSSSNNKKNNSNNNRNSDGDSDKKNTPISLTNDDSNFNESIKNQDNSDTEENKNNIQNYEPKENAKVLFFSILLLLACGGLAGYSYIKFGKSLLYEIQLGEQLKEKLNGVKTVNDRIQY